jgi:FkbM family methyltransferase
MSTLRLKVAQLVADFSPLFAAHLLSSRVFRWTDGQQGIDFRRQSISGSWVQANTVDEVGYFFALRGCYDWKVLACARAATVPGDTVIEVGANIGTETVGLADLVGMNGRVIAFEPVPANIARLKENSASLPQVQIIAAAASDSTGQVEFLLPTKGNSGVGRIQGAIPGSSLSTATFVAPTVTLDESIDPREKVTLMLIDAEGAEPMVLSGAASLIARNRPVVIFEAHHHLRELTDFFTSRDYDLYAIGRLRLQPTDIAANAGQGNWIALPAERKHLAASIDDTIRRCGILPQILWSHPLRRHSRRQ